VLAMGTLAVAIAIMIGVKALSSRPAKRPAKKPATEEKAKPEPEPEPEAVPITRDPFRGETQSNTTSKARAKGKGRRGTRSDELRLVGIMSGNPPLAVLRKGDRRYYVRAGETAAGYTVSSVGRQSVTLVKGEERLVLQLRPPSPEDEEE